MKSITLDGDDLRVNGRRFRACFWSGPKLDKDPIMTVLIFRIQYQRGVSLATIQKHLGISQMTLTKMAFALGIARRRGGYQASHRRPHETRDET
ncbi:MAG: hypothetical protein ABFD89_22710 [Bryobacteraceae bacterium]